MSGVITTRDGKELDVDFTLHMARQVIDDTAQNYVERGLAMSLEAALLELKKSKP